MAGYRVIIGMQIVKILGIGLVACALWAQNIRPETVTRADGQDAEGTKRELGQLLEHFPPNLRAVYALDPALLSNEAYISEYPALAGFMKDHPEVARNPSFYLGDYRAMDLFHQRSSRGSEDLPILIAFAMGIGLVTWLIRTLIDYRRWTRLSRVQTEVHTKLLDRFSGNEEILAYIQSPAGSKFLQSAPISLDTGTRSMSAPLGRILWSIQAGLVLLAAGIGVQIAAAHLPDDAPQLYLLGTLAIALGVGFAVSAGISFAISHRLGLIGNAAKSEGIA